ncbi:MAG: outer membrane protein assembly factor BamB, partial [Pirellulaceae bacterium]
AVNGFLVTMEQRGFEEWVSCYRVSDGKPIWINSIETRPRHESLMGGVGPRSTPTVDGNRVYVLGATGVLRCLDGATGDAIWVENILQRFGIQRGHFDAAVPWGRSASPLIVGNKVIVPAGGPAKNMYKTLAAYDKLTGNPIWTGGSWQISYSSPIVAFLGGKQQIVYVGESRVSGHDVDTGEELWNYKWPGSSSTDANTSQPVLTPEGHLFLSKGYGAGAALLEVLKSEGGGWTTNELWVNSRVMKTKFTNVTIHDGYVYGISDAVLECISLNTGDRRWKRGRYGHGQLLRVNDLLLVQAEEGEVVLLEANPNRHVELGKFQALVGKTWNNLCLYQDFLIARNAQEIACYQLGTKKVDDGGTVIDVLDRESQAPENPLEPAEVEPATGGPVDNDPVDNDPAAAFGSETS